MDCDHNMTPFKYSLVRHFHDPLTRVQVELVADLPGIRPKRCDVQTADQWSSGSHTVRITGSQFDAPSTDIESDMSCGQGLC